MAWASAARRNRPRPADAPSGRGARRASARTSRRRGSSSAGSENSMARNVIGPDGPPRSRHPAGGPAHADRGRNYDRDMRFGFVVPWADADEVGDLAATAEESGWDGIFVWEPVWGVDAWISLALAAAAHVDDPPRHPAHAAVTAATVGAGRPGGHRRPAVAGPGDAVGRARRHRQRASSVRRGVRSAHPRRADRRVPRRRDGPVERPAVRLRRQALPGQPTEFPTLGDTVQRPRVPIWCVGALGTRSR